MTWTALRWFGFGCSFILMFGGCHSVKPPFMRNGLPNPIQVRITYLNGIITDDLWQSGMEVACGRKDTSISEITIKSQQAVIHRLNASDISRMERFVGDMSKILWEIRKDRIVPLEGRR